MLWTRVERVTMAYRFYQSNIFLFILQGVRGWSPLELVNRRGVWTHANGSHNGNSVLSHTLCATNPRCLTDDVNSASANYFVRSKSRIFSLQDRSQSGRTMCFIGPWSWSATLWRHSRLWLQQTGRKCSQALLSDKWQLTRHLHHSQGEQSRGIQEWTSRQESNQETNEIGGCWLFGHWHDSISLDRLCPLTPNVYLPARSSKKGLVKAVDVRN